MAESSPIASSPFPSAAMFKDLIVPLTATSGDDDVINIGIPLAGSFGARLALIPVFYSH